MEFGIGYGINLPIYCGCLILLEIDSALNSLQHQPCIWVSYTLDTNFVVILFTLVWNLCCLLFILNVHVKEVGFSFYRMRSKKDKYNQTWMTSWLIVPIKSCMILDLPFVASYMFVEMCVRIMWFIFAFL